jgi:multidrug efflux pump
LVLVGGMAVGTLFTLFVIPSIYMLVARDHSQRSVHEPAGSTESDAPAPPISKPTPSTA